LIISDEYTHDSITIVRSDCTELSPNLGDAKGQAITPAPIHFPAIDYYCGRTIDYEKDVIVGATLFNDFGACCKLFERTQFRKPFRNSAISAYDCLHT
jgi:hypothetical protein